MARYCGHVAAPSRADHRVHAVEHGVAGEQHPFFLEEEARWLGAWPGVCSTSEPELRAFDRVALADDAVGHDVGVLVEALAVGEHLGAGGLHQPRGAGRMVRVRVREQHPAHPFSHRRADDGVDVALVVGSGVDDRDLVDPHEVGVGARTGERAGVRGDDAAHERRQRARARRESGRPSQPPPERSGRTSVATCLHLHIVGAPMDPRRALPPVDRVVAHAHRPAARVAGRRRARGASTPPASTVDDGRRRRRRRRRPLTPRHGVERRRRALLRPVVNATGVLLHTNLGRAPIGADALGAAPRASAPGTPTSSTDMDDGRTRVPPRRTPARCSRSACGAEAGLVVNNNAAAVLLALAALARGPRGRRVARRAGRDRRRLPRARDHGRVGLPARRGRHHQPHAARRLRARARAPTPRWS